MKKVLLVVLLVSIIGFVYYSKYNEIDKIITTDYEEKFDINDLYNSKEINYRYLLNDEEKVLYEDFINAIINFENKITLDLSFKKYNNPYEYLNNAVKISDAIIMDHPELLQYAYPTVSTSTKDGVINVTINYAFNEYDYTKYVKEIENTLTNIVNSVSNMSEYDKIKYVYDYLGNKNTYGKVDDLKSQSAISAFISEYSPVCSGYARASQIIFGRIGIHSILVTGDLKSTWLTGDSHAWNIVKVGNSYYNYDVTQSSVSKSISGSVSYMGLFSMNKSNFDIKYEDVTPHVSENKCDYYKLNVCLQ